jgi:hypothetical protein
MAEVPAPASASARQSSWPIYLYVPNLIGTLPPPLYCNEVQKKRDAAGAAATPPACLSERERARTGEWILMRVEPCLFFEGQFVCNRLCKDFGKCYGFWSGIHEQGFVCHTLLHKVLTTISDTFVASCHTVAAALCTPLFAWRVSFPFCT